MAAANKIMVMITGDPPAALQHHAGSFADMIERSIGSTWQGTYLRVDVRAPTALAAAPVRGALAAVVVTGSPASVHHRERWMVRAASWLRSAVDAGVPVLGICFGHQLLAQAFDGAVAENPLGREAGTVVMTRFQQEPLLQGTGSLFAANCFHDDTVVRLPPGATVLARSAKDAHQVLRFAPRCYGVQFHPEFDRTVMSALIRCRAASLSERQLSPGHLLARAQDGASAAQVLPNFVHRFAR